MSSKLPAITLLDSIALIDSSNAGTIVVTGSHGGRSAAGFVVDVSEKPSAVFFNDAGGGKDTPEAAKTMRGKLALTCCKPSE